MKEKLEKIKRIIKGNEPVYKRLNVKDLKTADYQRNFVSMQKVKEYAENFDWDIFETPLISFRDGEYWIVDGQHRIEVLKILGVETVFCKVLTNLNYQQEALKFNKLNTARRILNACDKFHSRVEAEDCKALSIAKILEEYDLTYSNRTKARKHYDKITAITVVENIYNEGGADHLSRVLRVLKEAWYGEPAAFGRDMMQGLSTFFKNSRGVNDGILVSCLERRMPKDVLTSAKMFGAENGMTISGGASKMPHVAKVIKDLYTAEKNRLKIRNVIQ